MAAPKKRLSQLAGDGSNDEKSATFVFQDEGHTLGNALRSIMVQYPEVEFCAYSVPHPAESQMHIRIQVKSGRAVDILRKGLEDLYRTCEHVSKTFDDAMGAFRGKVKMETN
ncbi:unnamed protein product [Trichogramma brassicae]|uniref:DNA-directed RNA polymerases I and III subunit RPAC2 n=1 Tax=Trichogramma brassicae TaxID=86971 RepID=A0A6H5IJC5_9HYME|nr:unnamed protein product [Trichogramma brassicae]